MHSSFGYINFSTVEEASNAIQQQHGGIYEGREVVVQFANTTYKTTRTESSPSMTLYLGNIPYELTDVDLQEIFEDLQGVKDVRIPVDRRTGLPRGFGHVDFVDQKAATEAKEILARKAPYGRKLIVNYAKRKVLTPENHARHQEKKLEKREAYLKRQAEREAQAAEQEQVQKQEPEQVQEPVKEQEQK
jgi:RNA recognition motif-containing protein